MCEDSRPTGALQTKGFPRKTPPMKNLMILKTLMQFRALGAVGVLLLAACGSPNQAVLFDDPDLVPRYATGQIEDVSWEARFNFPACDHSDDGRVAGAWCENGDQALSIELNGIESTLKSWIDDESVKSVTLAYFSFSNSNIARALCAAAEQRGLRVTLYIHNQQMNTPAVENLQTCSPDLVEVKPRGGTFGAAGEFIQHAKIFMASEMRDPRPLTDLTDREDESELLAASEGRMRFTSSSANMSGFGTSLHFENWLFFDTTSANHLAQSNLCFFKGLESEQDFAQIYKSCRDAIESAPSESIEFIAVPHGRINPRPYTALRSLARGAQESIRVAAHRMTLSELMEIYVTKAAAGVDVQIVYDDDTLRASVRDGGEILSMDASDVQSYWKVRDGGIQTSFVETNAGSIKHLQHNKYVIVDQKVVFQGAGNFTSAALNVSSDGNFEQFYVIRDEELAGAYTRAWEHLNKIASSKEEHPVGQNVDRRVRFDPESRRWILVD
jgi:hypothetical protein